MCDSCSFPPACSLNFMILLLFFEYIFLFFMVVLEFNTILSSFISMDAAKGICGLHAGSCQQPCQTRSGINCCRWNQYGKSYGVLRSYQQNNMDRRRFETRSVNELSYTFLSQRLSFDSEEMIEQLKNVCFSHLQKRMKQYQ